MTFLSLDLWNLWKINRAWVALKQVGCSFQIHPLEEFECRTSLFAWRSVPFSKGALKSSLNEIFDFEPYKSETDVLSKFIKSDVIQSFPLFESCKNTLDGAQLFSHDI
jgi:hypothetical protein